MMLADVAFLQHQQITTTTTNNNNNNNSPPKKKKKKKSISSNECFSEKMNIVRDDNMILADAALHRYNHDNTTQQVSSLNGLNQMDLGINEDGVIGECSSSSILTTYPPEAVATAQSIVETINTV
eukprot:4092696-Ditylum_brightwellii.AAC.1